jgi:hypothetical protein
MVGGMKRFGLALKAILSGRRPTLASGSLRLAGAVAAVALVGALSGQGAAQPGSPGQVFWPDQGWTSEVRARYHHQSQGTVTLPIQSTWFFALQQPDGPGLFADPAYLDRFGFIPSPRTRDLNPDGLPIGLTRTLGIDPRDNRPFDRIGFTCAACHTGRIEHRGNTIMIEGGPALTNLGDFRKQLASALGKMLSPLERPRLRAFADRVLGPGNTLAQRVRLHNEIAEVVLHGLFSILQNQDNGRSVEEGFGRLDALNRIGNQVFGVGMDLPRNYAPNTAPVAYPHIWDTSWFDWVQYNSSIMQPMVRNAGEAMGVAALVNYKPGPTRFASTIPVRSLHDNIEQQIAGARHPLADNRFTGLRSPAWPENILGRIDRRLAERGAELYRDRCQGCHLPAPDTEAFWTGRHWQPVETGGERYLVLNLIPIAAVGTDPAQAQDLKNRTVWVPADFGLDCPIGATCPTSPNGRLRRYPFGPALGDVVALVTNRYYDTHNVPQPERDRLNGNRPNLIQAPLSYKARPLNGIWATAPFLHNGSVPTLWALLSPYAERPTIFQLGNRQFDPQNVGYMNGGTFTLNTALAGNRNTGHLFETPASPAQRRPGTIGRGLNPDERRALIEYLKTL